jgi:hypothetical protein
VVDIVGLARVERNHAGEFVAAKPGDHRAIGHAGPDPARCLLQQQVAGGVAVHVVDLLEVVEIEHDERGRLAARRGPGDQFVGGRSNAAAVEAAGQRVGLGQEPGLLLGQAAFAHFAGQFAVTPPTEDHECDVEQDGVDQQRIRRRAASGQRAHDGRKRRPARADEHDDGGRHDPQRDQIALGRAQTSASVVRRLVSVWHLLLAPLPA